MAYWATGPWLIFYVSFKRRIVEVCQRWMCILFHQFLKRMNKNKTTKEKDTCTSFNNDIWHSHMKDVPIVHALFTLASPTYTYCIIKARLPSVCWVNNFLSIHGSTPFLPYRHVKYNPYRWHTIRRSWLHFTGQRRKGMRRVSDLEATHHRNSSIWTFHHFRLLQDIRESFYAEGVTSL